MNRIFCLKKSNLLKRLALLTILNVSFSNYATTNIPSLNEESDSINQLMINQSNETSKLKIIDEIFWNYFNVNIDRARYYGEWAYNEFKNSNNGTILNSIYEKKGILLMQEDKLDSANYFFTECLKLGIKVKDSSMIARAYFRLGYLNDALGNHDAAIKYYESSLNIYLKGKKIQFAFYSLEALTDMYMRSCIYDSADFYIKERIKIINSTSDEMNKIFTYYASFWYYKEMHNSIKSSQYMNDVIVEAEKNQSILSAHVYFFIAEYFLSQEKNKQIALEYCNRGIAKDTNNSYGYELLSSIYREEGKDSLSLKYAHICFNKANNRVNIANAYATMGRIYKKIGNNNLAIENFKEAYRVGYNYKDRLYFYIELLEIADLYLKENNPTEALNYYGKTLELAKKYDAKKAIIISNLKIGNFYQLKLQTNVAECYYLSAIQTAKKINDATLLKIVADTLNHFYLKRNDIKSAYQYLTISQIAGDSLSYEKRNSDIANLLVKFELEKIKKENEVKQALNKEELKRQKILRNSFLFISILLVGFGVLIFTSYKRKKRDNKILSERNDQIEAQVEEIISQKDEIVRISSELHESDEMKLHFFSNISHEFRTPLTLIMNPIQSILETYKGEGEYKGQLESIYKNAQKLLELTNEILDLQKLDAGKLQLNLEKADIIEFCLSIAASFESLCAKKNNAIRFTANHHSVLLLFDKDKIGKILINLLSNSLKFCHADSAIEIRIDILVDNLYLSVTDKGIGIPEEQINNVFKRYYQVPSDDQAQGTGIGLAYVKELIGFMKGTVTIESILNKGTKVNIFIPVKEFEINDSSECCFDIPKVRKPPITEGFNIIEPNENQNESSVLIIEDNDELRKFIANLLSTDFHVYLAKDGQEGTQAAFQFLPDIIISDVMMPIMNGYELCAKLKNDERSSHIPIILLTAKDTSQSSLEGYQAGADDYIIKPFDNELLKLKVRNVISTREAARKLFDFKSILSKDNHKMGDTDKDFMKKCLTIIESNIDNASFSVEKLANELAFSNRNFYRKIHALTNQTPAELIRVYRLHYAKQLLQNTRMKVFEIACAVGYEDIKSFRQAFKKQFGFLPSESPDNTTH